MDWKEVNDALVRLVRPQTFPLGIRLCTADEPIPEKARQPKRDFGFRIPVCQAIGIARRYGWTMAVAGEDESCPYGALTLGFVAPRPEYLNGSFSESLSPGAKEAGARSAQHQRRLEYGKYHHVLIAPIQSITFEPHLVAMYGNSAQVMRLVQGAGHGGGGPVTSVASGGLDCADLITQPMQTGQPHYVLPCNGDRIFALTQDDEMAFTMPLSAVRRILDGLEASHRSGAQRYPIPSFLRFNPQLPPSYVKLMEFLEE